MSEKISPIAEGIIAGLNESILDGKGVHVEGLRKTIVYPVKPKEISESLNMSQQEYDITSRCKLCVNDIRKDS